VPTYDYRCKACGHELEAVQAFSDDALTTCPFCHEAALRKVFSAVGISFKGGGFYKNDSRSSSSSSTLGDGGSNGASGSSSTSNGSSSSETSSSTPSTSSTASDTKPAKPTKPAKSA